MACHERLIHVKIASKSASVIISNPNGNSRFNLEFVLSKNIYLLEMNFL